MALQTFSAGSFLSYTQLAEWDGTNHDDIVAWINGLDTSTTDPALRWRVTAVTDRSVTFYKPGDPARLLPFSRDQEVIVGRGEWVSARPLMTDPTDQVLVQRVDPTGKWKTTDPHGRPGGVDDIVKAAGTGLGAARGQS